VGRSKLRDRESSLFVLSICLAAAPVRAQTAPVVTVHELRSIADVTASISMQSPADVNQRPACQELALPCLTPQTFIGFGFALSAGVYSNDVVGIVGELSTYPNHWAAYETNCDRAHSVCAVNQTNHVHAALAGLKGRTPLITGWSTRGRFFAQALVGPQWSDVGPRLRVFQPGIGYDGYLRNGIAVRVEWDYRSVPRAVRDLSTSRILAGIAVPLGSR
jgi:hypothetical protein